MSSARLFAPEVVQTSAMDCGPAALKCLLDGFGLHASYGRLREACQTDVDGTSIDTLEDLANDIGLTAEQIILPTDHVVASARDVLPAIAIVRRPGGLLHFVVAWRRHGPLLQVMDPATGRRWPRTTAFIDELFTHTMPLPADAWRRWAESDLFHHGLRAHARACGIGRACIDDTIEEALRRPGWRRIGNVDATLRMLERLRASDGIRASDAERTFTSIVERANAADDPTALVPELYWTVTAGATVDGVEHLNVRGAILVRVRGVRAATGRSAQERPLSREVAAAMTEPSVEPGRRLFSLLRIDGVLTPVALAAAALLAAAGVVLEALLFRSLLALGPHLALSGQRLAAMAAVIGLAVLLLALDVPMASAALGLGRRLETRLRVAFMEKIPRLADRYFQSRPSSDMAERGHSMHQIRELPNMGAHLTRSLFELLLTAIAIAALYPESAPVAALAAAVAVAVPIAAQPQLRERDLRQRTHSGALTRFYLDTFLGLVALRAHGAERAVAREQESLLVEWSAAGRALLRSVLQTSAIQLLWGTSLAAYLVYARVQSGDEGAGALLLAYWALNIPALGQEIAQIAWVYPTQRNLTLRLLEPLGALEEEPRRHHSHRSSVHASSLPGARVELRDVVVRAGGHTLLEEINVAIDGGRHIAIVGASGAGKSTLVGLLLGWHRTASGAVMVDGAPLQGDWLDTIRRQTAWVDPAVQLWNRSLVDNIAYGVDSDERLGVADRIADADLRRVIEQLPDGLQTSLGEGGALVSGGEGQRVRFARGLGRQSARLVILDEPFRGLERDMRATLLRRARDRWREATLVCVTHDISETAEFDRVLILADGRIIEDGRPSDLIGRPGSAYRSLIDAEARVRLQLSGDPSWRSLNVVSGRIVPGEQRLGTSPEPFGAGL